jgi:hypothetical protein
MTSNCVLPTILLLKDVVPLITLLKVDLVAIARLKAMTPKRVIPDGSDTAVSVPVPEAVLVPLATPAS